MSENGGATTKIPEGTATKLKIIPMIAVMSSPKNIPIFTPNVIKITVITIPNIANKDTR